jgi:hypothetical protein
MKEKESRNEFLIDEIESSRMKHNDLIFQKTDLEIKLKEMDLALEVNQKKKRPIKRFKLIFIAKGKLSEVIFL